MLGVVEEGTGASAAVEGYAVGGKTGTAEKLPRGNGKYLVSFIGYAPQENPQVMVYVVIDEPNSAVQANSGYATQLASQIMTDIFPYLGIEKKTDSASNTDTRRLRQHNSKLYVHNPIKVFIYYYENFYGDFCYEK